MNIIVLEDKKSKLTFETEGIGHTFLNVLKTELWNDDKVKVATYSVRHPIISKPKFILETDGTVEPRQALTNALGRLKRTSEKIRKEAQKEIK